MFCGAGKVGCEVPGTGLADVPYQLSQRADFFEEEVGLETTLKRPIINTRDEPHADPSRYRRLHVIVGDANLAEVSTYLKVATTSLVLNVSESTPFGEGPGVSARSYSNFVATQLDDASFSRYVADPGRIVLAIEGAERE